ncbi:MAG: contractile injection system tape measure protein [Bacteroidia bacterium]
MSEDHVIGRQLFDLHFYSQKEAYNLQTKVSYLNREKLKFILEKQLTAFSSPGVVIRLDQLELDLGDIPYERIEEEFPARFEAALKKSLAVQVEEAWRQPGSQGSIKRLPDNMLLLLQLFLLNGHLPWWSKAQETADPDAWIDTVLESSPSELVKMLRTLGKTEPVHRLVRQFSETRLEKIVRVLEPSEAAFIITYAHDIDVVHQRKPLVQESGSGFRKAKWLVIFTYLLVERGSQFNRRAFLKSTIAGLAAHYNLDYGVLLMQLAEAAEHLRKTTGFESSLPGFVRTLELEYREEHKEQLEKKFRFENKTEHTVLQQQFLIFEHFLLHGSLPAGQPLSLPAFDKLALELLLSLPEKAAVLLRSTVKFQGALERFVKRTKEKTIEQAIIILEPENAPFIIGYAHTLNSVQERVQLVPVPLNEFKTDKWLFVLRHLLIDRGSYFNTRSFIKSTLQQMAAHYNTSYSKLITLFGLVAEKQVRTRSWHSSLPVIVLELARENEKESAAKKEDAEEKSSKKNNEQHSEETLTDVNKMYDVLHHFFITGKIAWWARPEWQTDDIGRLMLQLHEEHPSLVVTLTNEIAKDEKAFDRFLAIANDTILLRVLPLVSTSEGALLIPWITSLNERLQKLGGRKKAEGITSLLYRRLLYGFTIARKSRFDSTAFMNEVLGEIAVRYGITARASMEFLADAVDRQNPSGRLTLSAMLKKVHDRAGAGFYQDENAVQSPGTETVEIWLKAETENQALEKAHALKAAAEDQAQENERSRKAYTEAELWVMLAMSEEGERLLPMVPLLDEKQLLAVMLELFPGAGEHKIKELLRKYKKASVLAKKERRSSDEQLLLDSLRGAVTMEPRTTDELVKRLLRSNPEQLKRILLQLLSVSPLRRRFAAAVHETTLIKVLALLYGPSSHVPLVLMSDVLLLVKELVSKNPGSIPLAPIRDLCLLLALQKSASSFSSLQWLQVILSASGIYSGRQADELALAWKKYLAEFPGEWKSEFPVLLHHLSDPLYLKRLSDSFLARLEKIKEKAAAEERQHQIDERKEKQKADAVMDDERGIFIRNAGLILLWPFFPRLFERAGLVNGISFVSEAAAYRAVHLLQYMVDKSEQTPEYNLVLNKLLCNISKAKPVEKEVVLTEEEKESANQLLGAAVKHWDALGETSTAGLQETFLQRGGQLFFFESKYELRVERKAFDKLLSRLPWSISPVKLPWMKKPLYVEWKT